MCVKIAAMVRTLAGGLALQAAGIKMFDKHLVHALIGGKDLNGGSVELNVKFGLAIDDMTRGHGGSLLLDL
jgi:hypothetical protein